MKRLLKVLGKALGSLVVVVVLTVLFFSWRVESKRNDKIAVDVSTIEIPTDAASIAEGKRLVQVKACADCHGADLGGKTFIQDPPIGKFSGSNITSGKGSVVSAYTDVDWIRSIRYAIAPNGRPLNFMPAADFHGMSNEDMGKMIAALKSWPAVDRETIPVEIGPMARVLYSAGQMGLLFPYEEVDLQASFVEKVEVAPTVEYGRYLSQACIGCHGPGFAGGKIPGTPPSWTAAGNLTPGGSFVNWTIGDFKKVLAEGVTPNGHQIDPQYMPWKSMQAMTDVEMEALFKFLKQVPAKADGSR